MPAIVAVLLRVLVYIGSIFAGAAIGKLYVWLSNRRAEAQKRRKVRPEASKAEYLNRREP